MTARTKSKLVLATRAIGLAVPTFVAIDAMASVVGPYSADGNTVALYHFNEAAGSSFSFNEQPFPSQNNAIGFNQPTNSAAGTPNTTLLGQAGATGLGFGNFGNAAGINVNGTTGTGLLFGYDADGNGLYDPDFNGHTPGADAVSSSLLVGGNGAFTLEALVNFGNLTLAQVQATNKEIVSFDSSTGRDFQFRINTAGQLEYNNINDTAGSALAAIPTTGANAYAPNTWYHVAMAFDGTGTASTSSVRLYWTKLDDSATRANLIGSGSAGLLSANTSMLTFGNENRNSSSESLNGYLDELRISNTFRTADQFLFAGLNNFNAWNNSSSGDWDTAGNWTVAVPNAPSALADFGDGNNLPSGNSTITLNGTKTVGTITFNSAFQYALVSGTSGAIALDNGVGVPATVGVLTGSHIIDVPVGLTNSGNNFSINGNATLTVSGVVGGSASATLSKVGGGVLVLSGTNTYSGVTTINEGAIRANVGVGLPTTSNLTLSGGVLQTGADVVRAAGAGAGSMQITSGASGFSAVGASITVVAGTLVAPTALTWGGGNFAPTTFILNDSAATGGITFLNPINLGAAARTIQVDANTATLSGALTGTTASLTKNGGGTLVITGTSTYTGATTVNGGTLRATSGVGLPTNSSLTLNNALWQPDAATVTRTLGTAAGNIQITGGNAGFVANGSDLVININNGGSPIAWGGATFNPTTLVLNTAANQTNSITFTAPLDLGTAAHTVSTNGETVSFTGAITGSGTNPLQFVGTGLAILSGSNSYTNPAFISVNGQQGPTASISLRATSSNALGSGTVSLNSTGNAALNRLELTNNITLPNYMQFWARSLNNPTPQIVNLSGNNTLSGQLVTGVGGANYLLQSDAGVLTLSGAASGGVSILGGGADVGNPGGGRNVTMQGTGNGVISGTIVNGTASISMIKVGTGQWTMSGNNTYTGTTTVGQGTLVVSSLGNGSTTSNIGASSNAAANLIISGGTLKYTGAGGSTDRLFTITPAGGGLDASGASTIAFNNGGAIVSADAGSLATAANLSTTSAVVQLPNVTNLVLGMTVTGTNIPAGTTIAAVNPTLLQITLSATPTAAAADTLSFGIADRALGLTGTGIGVLGNVLSDSSGGAKLGITKSGTGRWILSAANNYTGLTTVASGALELASAAQSPVFGSGQADIQGGRLVLDGASAATIQGLLSTGYGGNFATGPIHSSNATSAIGLGMSDDGTAVTVARAYYGDANLDGSVNALDFNALASNFGGGSGKFWSQGDFNYDGSVNTVDFNQLAVNFNQTLSSSPALGALVPEPGIGALLMLGLPALKRRTRRKDR